MNTSKDTKNKSVANTANKDISYISVNVPETISRTIADKSQKIVKAVYLVTHLISETDTLGSMIRVKALSAMELLLDSSRLGEDSVSLKNAHHTLYELLSYLDIAYQTELVSHMNYTVLLQEVHALQDLIHAQKNTISGNNKDSLVHKTSVSLSDLFSKNNKETEDLYVDKNSENIHFRNEVKNDNQKDDIVIKKIVKNNLNNKEISKTILKKSVPYIETKNTELKVSLKDKRHSNILNILKQKKDASITDVCSLFKDCSSKTIQRDLKELIKNKKVVKRGDRRWAVYNLK